MIRKEVESLADNAKPIQVERPAAGGERFEPFPVTALPEPLRGFVVAGSKAIGCDASYIALPLLAAAASAIGNTRRIRLKRGWSEPAILWTVIVGESGTLKTPPFKAVIGIVRERQAKALRRYAEATANHEQAMMRYEREVTAWKHGKDDSEPPVKPEAPSAERFIVSDTTVEALAPILLANPRGVLLARDELAGWIASFDRYSKGNSGADAAHWLSMHNGEAIIVDRKTGQPRTIYVPSASVSITGGVQPAILHRALGVEHRESGLAARLLLAWPPRRPKRWTEAEIPEEAEVAVEAVIDSLYGLRADTDDNGDPRPVLVPMTPEGKSAWITFYNEHAQEEAGLTGDLAAAWSKLEGYAARLALIVHFVRWAINDASLNDPDAIDEVSITSGVTLARWFAHEARRVYARLGESDENRDRRQLVELIERKGGAVTVRNWQRARSHRTSEDAEAELADLESSGYGCLRPAAQSGRGAPSKVFTLHDDRCTDTDNNPAPDAESAFLSVSEPPKDPASRQDSPG